MERSQYSGSQYICELCTNEMSPKRVCFLTCEAKNLDGQVQIDTFKCHKHCAEVFSTKQIDKNHFWTDNVDVYLTLPQEMYYKLDKLKKIRRENHQRR